MQYEAKKQNYLSNVTSIVQQIKKVKEKANVTLKVKRDSLAAANFQTKSAAQQINPPAIEIVKPVINPNAHTHVATIPIAQSLLVDAVPSLLTNTLIKDSAKDLADDKKDKLDAKDSSLKEGQSVRKSSTLGSNVNTRPRATSDTKTQPKSGRKQKT